MHRIPRCVLAALSLLVCACVQAQTFPDKPVHLIVGFPPGTTVDIVARLIGDKLKDAWKQPVVIENRPGAGGNVGAAAVARAAPDGHTLLLANNGVAISATMHRNLPYDPVKDLAISTLVTSLPFVMVFNPKLPANSIAELIALAKSRPGQLNFGSGGIGNADHLAAELFASMAGVKMVHVPYQGGTLAMRDVARGEIAFYFSGVAAALPLITSGQVKALGTSGAKRSNALPDVPTIAEALPGYEVLLWNGLLAPSATPRSVLDRISVDTGRVLRLPEVQERLKSLGLDIAPSSPADAGSFFKAEVEKWGKVTKAVGLAGQ